MQRGPGHYFACAQCARFYSSGGQKDSSAFRELLHSLLGKYGSSSSGMNRTSHQGEANMEEEGAERNRGTTVLCNASKDLHTSTTRRRLILSDLLRLVPYPTQQDKHLLCKTLAFTSLNQLNDELLHLRQMERYHGGMIPQQSLISKERSADTSSTAFSHTKKTIPARVKRILKQFLQNQATHAHIADPHPSRPFQLTEIPMQDLVNLAHETKLSRKQLRFQLEYLSSPMGRMTHEKRTFLKRFIEDKKRQQSSKTTPLLEHSDYLYLEEQLGVSRYQLYSIIHYASEKRGKVTQRKKLELEKFMRNQKYDSATETYMPLSEEEFNSLQEKLGWSSYQLRFQIKRISEHSTWVALNVSTRQRIKQFLEMHPEPSVEQLESLRREHNLNRDQFRTLRYRLNSPCKEMSTESKELLRSWLSSHGFRRPNSEQVDELMNQTGMGRIQLHSTIATLIDPPGTLTDEKKQRVRNAIKNSNHLSDEQFETLRTELDLGRKQLRNLITTIRDPLRRITQEKKETIHTFLEGIGFMKPTSQQVSELARSADLSRKQVNQLVSHILFQPSQCSRESSEMIHQWLKEHSYDAPSREQEKELIEESGLNLQQVRYQVNKHRHAWRQKQSNVPKE